MKLVVYCRLTLLGLASCNLLTISLRMLFKRPYLNIAIRDLMQVAHFALIGCHAAKLTKSLDAKSCHGQDGFVA